MGRVELVWEWDDIWRVGNGKMIGLVGLGVYFEGGVCVFG